MKRFFIIFVMLVAIGTTQRSNAQTSIFLSAYKLASINTSKEKGIEITHLTGEMLEMMVKKDSKDIELLPKISSIYQIKIQDVNEAPNAARAFKGVPYNELYKPCGAFTNNGVKYEIYKNEGTQYTSRAGINEYLIYITNGKQMLVCDIYGAIGYKEVLSMISPSLPQKNDLQIDTLNTN
ncbi:MAG: DUF4252 domain-containing protein [Alistipes sp.]|nr:DUF4252 domain-containing protein [Alistipes sp.]